MNIVANRAENGNDTMTTGQAALLFDTTPRQIRAEIHAGNLDARKIGDRFAIPIISAVQFRRARYTNTQRA